MMDNLTERAKALSDKALARSADKPVTLPTWPDSRRGTPNTFLRSALFSAIQSKDRVDMKDEVLASQEGITISYTGEQLNQEDLTLWETLVHLARDTPLGTFCEFSAHEILTAMQLDCGGKDRKVLDAAITRLNACSVRIKHKDKSYFGSLIVSGMVTEPAGLYAIQLDRQLFGLYSQTTWIDWEQRLMIRRKPLAQALHGYYSSHNDPFPVKLETLRKFTGSRNKQKSDFKRKVAEALQNLINIGFLESFAIENDLVTVNKSKTACKIPKEAWD